MKIPYFCCIGAELKRYAQDFDFMNQVYLYKVPTDDSIDEVLDEDYFKAISNSVLQDDIVYIYEASAETLHECRFDKQNGHITAVPLASDETLTGAVTSIIHNNLTPNKLLKSDENGKVAASDFSENDFVKKSGDTMTGVLKMRASVSFECAIAPYWHGVGLYKLNDDDSVTLLASMEATDGWEPGANNTYNMGTATKKWKNLYLAGKAFVSTINNGFDIAVPVTNSADTFALKSQVDLAANSGSQLYTTGVWYAKMYSASVVPTGAEYDGRNYADFSQVDNDNNPIIVIYEGQSGAWVEIDRITPPAAYNGYVTITSKIWDIAEQTDQQGGEILWSYSQKTFTPYPKIVNLLNQANTDLSNLTATGKNIGNWSSNVTNCITEIPQDINLELNNGTLTLKAGSKLYKPNGADVFDTFIVETDLSRSIWGSGSTDFMVAFDTVNSTWDGFNIANCYSGPTAPTGGTNMLWYDTTNNKVKQTSDSGSTWNDGWTLPICIVSRSSGVITGINQVFNGFGYIGSTVFILPGVKGLIPDGRNADGSLKSIAYTNTTVVSQTLNNDYENFILVFGETYSIQVLNPISNIEYRKAENIIWSKAEYRQNKVIFGGRITSTTGGQITSFTPKTAFHAVDYNEADFVVSFQRPTADNGYTWYRKYKSGWVEQGGVVTLNGTISATNKRIDFPITMADTEYYANGVSDANVAANVYVGWQHTTYMTIGTSSGSNTGKTRWEVKGMAA